MSQEKIVAKAAVNYDHTGNHWQNPQPIRTLLAFLDMTWANDRVLVQARPETKDEACNWSSAAAAATTTTTAKYAFYLPQSASSRVVFVYKQLVCNWVAPKDLRARLGQNRDASKKHCNHAFENALFLSLRVMGTLAFTTFNFNPGITQP